MQLSFRSFGRRIVFEVTQIVIERCMTFNNGPLNPGVSHIAFQIHVRPEYTASRKDSLCLERQRGFAV